MFDQYCEVEGKVSMSWTSASLGDLWHSRIQTLTFFLFILSY